MEKLFIPYELSVKLKELRFKRTCLAEYIDGIFHLSTSLNNKKQALTTASAPLWQQSFDWFREKHDLPNWVYESVGRWYFKIVQGDFWVEHREIGHYKTYEEARQACLEKLIQIIADENKTNKK